MYMKTIQIEINDKEYNVLVAQTEENINVWREN